MTTPLEQAKHILAELEAKQSEVARESHRLQSEIGAAKLAGDLAALAELQQQFSEVNNAHVLGRSRILEAQENVRVVQNELHAARNRVASLNGELDRTQRAHDEAHERAISLARDVESLRQQCSKAQERLAALEPATTQRRA